MITKKLNKITFGWDPTAFKGKGYWYVVGKNDSFSRAASRAESQKLGMPKESEKPPKDVEKKNYYYGIGKHGKPVRKQIYTGSDYEMHDITRSKGLMQLASERMMGGESLGSSLFGAIKEKSKARGSAIKKMFDPMNILSKLPGIGKLAATAWGMKRKRSAADISYFTGVHAPDNLMKEEPVVPKQSYSPMVSGGGGSTAEEIKQEEDARYKEQQEGVERRHKELIEAITGKYKKEEKQNSSVGLLSLLKDGVTSFLGLLKDGLTKVIEGLLALLAGKTVMDGIGGRMGGGAGGKDSKRTKGGPKTKAKKIPNAKGGAFGRLGNIARMARGVGIATLPLLAMYGVKEWVEDTSQDKERVEALQGIGNKLNNLMGIDPDKKQKEWREKKDKELGVTPKATKINTTETNIQKKSVEEELRTLQESRSVLITERNKTKDPKAIESYNHNIQLMDKQIESYKKIISNSSTTSTVIPSKAEILPTPPSPLGQLANQVTMENKNLADTTSNVVNPVVINKNTNVVNNGGMSAIGGPGGRIRNDDAILLTVQYQNVRPV